MNFFDVRSKVRNVRVNSTPENKAKNWKCRRRSVFNVLIRFSALTFGSAAPLAASFEPLTLALAFSVVVSSVFLCLASRSEALVPLVSGSETIRKSVSAKSSTRVMSAGTA